MHACTLMRCKHNNNNNNNNNKTMCDRCHKQKPPLDLRKLAPNTSSNCAIVGFSSATAWCSAVRPFLSTACTLAPCSRSARTQCISAYVQHLYRHRYMWWTDRQSILIPILRFFKYLNMSTTFHFAIFQLTSFSFLFSMTLEIKIGMRSALTQLARRCA